MLESFNPWSLIPLIALLTLGYCSKRICWLGRLEFSGWRLFLEGSLGRKGGGALVIICYSGSLLLLFFSGDNEITTPFF